MDVMELRGHHLESIANLYKRTFEEHAEELLADGYVKDKGDKFVDFSYNYLRELFENPGQKFLIASMAPDFICRACNKLEGCFDGNGKLRNPPKYSGKIFDTDSYEAKTYGFEVGRVYSVGEIRERMDF